MSTKINVNCGFCKEEIIKTKKQIDKSKTKVFYCNVECRINHQKTISKELKTELICPMCEEPFYVTNYWIEKRKFCSRACKEKHESILKTTEVKCEYCETHFLKWDSKVTEMNFCSHDCQRKWLSEIKYKDSRVAKSCIICEKEFTTKLSIEERTKTCSKECQNKYLSILSEYIPSITEIRRQSGLIGYLNRREKDTLPEKIVRDYLVENNIAFESQKMMYDKFIVDFYLVDYDIILEVYGDYWHSNPKIYGYEENKKEPNEKQLKQIKKDKSRKAYLTKCGHTFVYIWECDIYENVEKQIKQIINQNS